MLVKNRTFLSKLTIIAKNQNYRQKSKLSLKFLKMLEKIEIWAKIQNYGHKSKL